MTDTPQTLLVGWKWNIISQESNKPGPQRASSSYGAHRIPLQAIMLLPNPRAPVRCSALPMNCWDPSLPAAIPESHGGLAISDLGGQEVILKRRELPNSSLV